MMIEEFSIRSTGYDHIKIIGWVGARPNVG